MLAVAGAALATVAQPTKTSDVEVEVVAICDSVYVEEVNPSTAALEAKIDSLSEQIKKLVRQSSHGHCCEASKPKKHSKWQPVMNMKLYYNEKDHYAFMKGNMGVEPVSLFHTVGFQFSGGSNYNFTKWFYAGARLGFDFGCGWAPIKGGDRLEKGYFSLVLPVELGFRIKLSKNRYLSPYVGYEPSLLCCDNNYMIADRYTQIWDVTPDSFYDCFDFRTAYAGIRYGNKDNAVGVGMRTTFGKHMNRYTFKDQTAVYISWEF